MATKYLSTLEKEAIRNEIEALLPDTCEIDYLTNTSDGMGGWTEAWTARGTAIACRLSPAHIGAYAGMTGEQVKEGQVWVLSLHHDQTVTVKDRVIKGGETYRVLQVNTGESEIGGTRVYVELLE